jgi:hypothetical protein
MMAYGQEEMEGKEDRNSGGNEIASLKCNTNLIYLSKELR